MLSKLNADLAAWSAFSFPVMPIWHRLQSYAQNSTHYYIQASQSHATQPHRLFTNVQSQHDAQPSTLTPFYSSRI